MDMQKLVSVCRKRGFIFGSSEIYGGINGFWDYGPLGVELKNNIKAAWWHDMVRNPPLGPDGKEIQMVGVDCSIIMNPKVWEASGHVGGFADPMVDCKACKARFRADQFVGIEIARDQFSDTSEGPKQFYLSGVGTKDEVLELHRKSIEKLQKAPGALSPTQMTILTYLEIPEVARSKVPCPECKQSGHLTEPRAFNLMFQTYVGALQDAANIAYLRPETAQGIFANFKNVVDSSRVKIPFGIAQIGKAFRNEINPRNYTFRSREFEQMEIEFFCHPDESMKWFEYWRSVRKEWYTKLGIKSDKLRPRDQGEKELAHYSKACTDIEYMFPFSDEPQELEGVAHRGAYDLTQHSKHSGKDMSYFEEDLWAKADKSAYGNDKKALEAAKLNLPYRYVPHVIEPSAGADRFTLAVLCEAYCEDKVPNDKGEPEERLVMKFHPRLAPIKAAIFPLVNKEGMPDKAYALYRELKNDFNVQFDDKGAVGRRYRRQDEAGTPCCITIDGQTLQDETVTIRDRDSLQQRRVKMAAVADELRSLLKPK